MRHNIVPGNKKPSANIETRSIESTHELRMAVELMAEEHARDSLTARRWLLSCGEQYPNYRREHTRVAFLKNELAAAMRITTDTVRIGEARLKMGGLGWVTTAKRYRNKGVAHALIHDAVDYMRLHGYHASLLFGPPAFYRRFGFVTAISDFSVCIDTHEALGRENPFKRRSARPSDIPSLLKIHNATEGDVACSLLRTSAHLRNRWQRWPDWTVLLDPRGKTVGYFYPCEHENHLVIAELGAIDPHAFPALLRATADYAAEKSLSLLEFSVPPNHAFVDFAQQFETMQVLHIQNQSPGMMMLIDISEALESMIPEWESLLAQCTARDLKAEVNLVIGNSNVRIRCRHGVVDVSEQACGNRVSLSAGELMSLLVGYLHLDDVLQSHRYCLRPEARLLLYTLFPKRHPYIWSFDRF